MHGRIKPLALLLVSLLVLTLVGGIAFYRPFQSEAGVSPAEEPHLAEVEKEPPPARLPGKRQTFLVMGVDYSHGIRGRSDSMLLATYDPAAQRIAVLSLPRDTWVEIPGRGFDKLNHAYAFGGERLAILTVQRWLDIPIDHYVTISYQGFIKIVDALGGVEIDAQKRLYYVDPTDTSMGPEGLVIDIQPGRQTMDGITALKYARFRMDEEGDFGRMRRQQQLIKAMMRKAAQPATLTRVHQLIPALADTIGTDLSIGQMVKLASGAGEVLTKPLETGSLAGQDAWIGDVYYLIPNVAEQRVAAYRLLVGKEPPAEFVQRAQETQAAYQDALQETLARAAEEAARKAEEAARAEEETTGDSGEQEDTGTVPVLPSPDDGDGDSDAPGDDPAEDGDGSSGDTPPGDPPPDDGDGDAGSPGEGQPGDQDGTGASPEPLPPLPGTVKVAVIDASGSGLSPAYVQRLTGAGFSVIRSGDAFNTVDQTVVLDHGAPEEAIARLQQVMPGVMIVSAPDRYVDAALEVILGRDLTGDEQP